MKLEYTVIDEKTVIESIQLERSLANNSKQESSNDRQVEAKEGEPEEPIVFSKIQVLRLSYKNVLRIDNLIGFEALHTLCLDNNVIEDIENISHLVNLTWLDLSFNNISSIQGVENLVNLKDLSLYGNNIETIDKLGSLTQLECISLGRNKINKLENLLYLRQFKKLQVVTLEGNPVCKDPEYRFFVLAYLPNLKYVDYALVGPSEVISAREQYQDELLEAQERETLEKSSEQAAKQHGEYLKTLRAANLIILETLFTDMFSGDKELSKLQMLPGFDTILDSYQHEYRIQVETSVNSGLELSNRYGAEFEKIDAAYNKLTAENELVCIGAVQQFTKRKKIVHQKISSITDPETAKSDLHTDLADLGALNHDLKEQLMTLETQQVQQLKSLLDIFENRAMIIRAQRVEHATSFFRAVEDLENSFASASEDLANDLMEKLVADQLDDLPEETLSLLSDRDTLLMAIQGVHDNHLGKLLAEEDITRDGIINSLTVTVTEMKGRDTKQNRDRVFEIAKIFNGFEADIDSLRTELKRAEDDES